MSLTDKLVLVADDELHLTHIVQFKLEQAGLRVMTANDGEEAFALAQEHLPDLVITDYQMPVLDGYDFCVKLREHTATSAIPVLMLTARGHKLSPSQLARTNIGYLMAKPFSAHELMDKALELLTACAEKERTIQTRGQNDLDSAVA